MQIEYIARICFTSRRTLQQQRHRTVRDRMFRKIVVDDQNILALFHPLFADRTPRIGRNVLQRRRFRSTRVHDRRIFHRIRFFQTRRQTCYRRLFLANGNINAVYVLTLLVNDRIYSNRCLTRLTVTDDQLTLTLADRDHRVNDLQTRHQRLINGTARHDTRRNTLNRTRLLGLNITLIVNRLTKRIYNAAKHRIPDRNLNDSSRAADFIALFDLRIAAKQNSANVILLEVHDHSHDPVREHQQLRRHRLINPLNHRNAISDTDDIANIIRMNLLIVIFYLLLDEGADLFRTDLFHACPPFSNASRIASMRAFIVTSVTLPSMITLMPAITDGSILLLKTTFLPYCFSSAARIRSIS